MVAFVGAYRNPGRLDPVGRGRARRAAHDLGDVRAVLPDHLPRRALRRTAPRQRRDQRHALRGITAAVVGVIANLALYFALHTLFRATTVADLGPLHLELPNLTTLVNRTGPTVTA